MQSYITNLLRHVFKSNILKIREGVVFVCLFIILGQVRLGYIRYWIAHKSFLKMHISPLYLKIRRKEDQYTTELCEIIYNFS